MSLKEKERKPEITYGNMKNNEITKKDKIRRLILVGKAASGKDYVRKQLEKLGMKYCVSHTTRPPRDGEVNGIDYYFINVEQFSKMIERSEFYECVKFNYWLYGTSILEFENSNLFIMTPSGIEKLKPEHRSESLIIYLDISEDFLIERLSQRNDADSAERRLISDREDFKFFNDFDIRITDPNFTLNSIVNYNDLMVLEFFQNVKL